MKRGMKISTYTNGNDIDSKKNSNIYTCDMIIDIINDSVIHALPFTGKGYSNIEDDSDGLLNNISFQSIIQNYNLDFKQSVAFEIMACSFILQSLSKNKVNQDSVDNFFDQNETKRNESSTSLKNLKNNMTKKVEKINW